MVTKEQVKRFRSGKKELKMIRAMIRQAELEARMTGNGTKDEQRARKLAARYESLARHLDREQQRIEAVIDALNDPRQRQVLRCRYILGWSRVKTACEMGLSERMVARLAAAGFVQLEKSRKCHRPE